MTQSGHRIVEITTITDNMNNESKWHFRFSGRFAGEFIVIVLGVLAALAVDSWSEDRNDRVLEENYLSRLKVDLERDLQQIGRARWASFAQARATTTLLFSIGDPLAGEIPEFTENIQSIDFTVPATEVISDTTMGDLVWFAKRVRSFSPSQSTYDEMLATGRLLVIYDQQLRTDVINYYSLTEGSGEMGEWISEAATKLEEVLRPTGFNAFDFGYIDEPLPLLRDLKDLGFVLRDIRRRSLRQVWFLEQVEKEAKELTNSIEDYFGSR